MKLPEPIVDVDISDNLLDATIDFDKLDNDPVEQEKMNRLKVAQTIRANTFTTDEFEHYSALFNKAVAESMSHSELQTLSEEYMGRIDPYNPIYIVKAKDSYRSTVLLRESNLVNILPPVYNRVGVVNNLGRDGVDLLQAFNNLASAEVDDRFDQKKIFYTKHLQTVFNNMTDEQKRVANGRRSQQLAKEAVRLSGRVIDSSSSDSSEEVQDVPETMLKDLQVAEAVTADKSVTTAEQEEFL